MNTVRLATHRAVAASRTFSTRPALRNTSAATSFPVSETMRNVAERASSAMSQQSSVEGFKAGVVYTLLAGSAAAAAVLVLSPTGDKTVQQRDLL